MTANEPDFPPNAGWIDNIESCRGITKREYFAAKAMAAMLSNIEMYNDNMTQNALLVLSTDSFLIADEMIKASKVQS